MKTGKICFHRKRIRASEPDMVLQVTAPARGSCERVSVRTGGRMLLICAAPR